MFNKTWKLFIMPLVLVIITALFGCGGGASGSSGTPTASSETPAASAETPAAGSEAPAAETENQAVKVCVVMSGMLGDLGFNDLLKMGTDRAEQDFGVTVKLIEAANTADFEGNLLAACEGGYDFIICQGPGFSDLLKTASETYPDQKFAITDAVVSPTPANVMCIVFAPNEGQFLVGAAMAMFTTKTDIPGVRGNKIVGWISGNESPNILDFYAGFEHGVHYIDPEITILQAFAGTYSDPIKGKELALAQYEQGADIIAQVANRTGLGIIEAAVETGRFCVGVDQDQDALAPGNILTSMLKQIDEGVYAGIKSVVDGSFKGGGYIYLDLASGGIGITDFSVFREYWGDELFPQDIVDKCEELKAMIAGGEIVVNVNPAYRTWENQ